MRGAAVVITGALMPADARERLARHAAEAAPGISVHLVASAAGTADLAAAAEAASGYALPASFVERAPHLKWIHALTAGVDQFLDLPGVRDGRIVLTRTVGAHTALPEHVMALVLAFSRRLHADIRNQVARRWDRAAGVGDELAGRTMGILGLGQIGRPLAALASAFGMRVIGARRTAARVPHVDEVFPPQRADDLLRQADYVVVLLPVTPETRGYIGDRELALMKQTAVLINVSRGAIVQEQALVRALQDGRIAGAGLDVFDREPLPPEHPLYALDRVIITPHVSGITPRYHERVAAVFCENLRRYAAGEPLLHVVDPARGY